MPQTGIAVPSSKDALINGERIIQDPVNVAGLKTLVAYMDSGNSTTFREQGSGSHYTVPGGKTFKCKYVRNMQGQTGFGSIALGYSVNGVDNTTAPGSPTYQNPAGSNVTLYSNDANNSRGASIDGFNIPAGSKPFAKSTNLAQVVYLYGTEE
jgi:hypothetical protein